MPLQFVQGADARKQQQLRRAKSASAKDHFAACLGGFTAPLAAIAHTRRALAVEDDPGRLRAGDDGEIRAVHHRMQIGGRSRATFAIPVAAPELGDLIKAGAFLFDPLKSSLRRIWFSAQASTKARAIGRGLRWLATRKV